MTLTVKQATVQMLGRCIELADKNDHPEIVKLCKTAIDKADMWPIDKLNRWLGYAQGVLISYKVTTVWIERNFSRPLFHEAYKNENIDVPKSVDINDSNSWASTGQPYEPPADWKPDGAW